MKYTKYLIIAICGLLLGACSEKSTNAGTTGTTVTPGTATNSTSIQGKWEAQRGPMKIQLILNADETSAVSMDGTTFPTGTWKQEGNKLIIHNPDLNESTNMKIISQSETQLVIEDAENSPALTYTRIN